MNSSKLTDSLLVRNTVLNFFGQLIPLLIGIITIPLIIRGLGVEGFGVLSLIWVMLGHFGLFDLGLGLTTTKFMAEVLGRKEMHNLSRLFWNTVTFQVALGILGGIGLTLVTPLLITKIFHVPPYLINETKNIFYLLALSVPFVILSETLSGALQAAQRFDLVNAVKTPASVAIFLFPALGILVKANLFTIIAIIIASKFVAFLAYFALCFRTYPSLKQYSLPRGQDLKILLSFGGWITVSKIMSPILNYFERFLIVSLLSVGALTFYSAPFEIISRIIIFPASIALTIFPAFSYYGKDNSSVLSELFSRPIKYLLFVITPVAIFFFVFADKILGWWIGEQFVKQSTVLLQILTAAFFFNAFAFVPLVAIQGLGRPDLKAKLDLVLTPIFIVLLYFSIRIFGLNGAALAKFIVATLDTICLFWFAEVVAGLSIRRLFSGALGRGILISFIFTFFIFLFVVTYKFFVLKLSFFLLCTIIYIFLFWKFALDDKDKSLLTNIRKHILNREVLA